VGWEEALCQGEEEEDYDDEEDDKEDDDDDDDDEKNRTPPAKQIPPCFFSAFDAISQGSMYISLFLARWWGVGSGSTDLMAATQVRTLLPLLLLLHPSKTHCSLMLCFVIRLD